MLGTLWWWFRYSSPSEEVASLVHKKQIQTGVPVPVPQNWRWIDLLRVRESWGLVGAKFLSDGAWYFYLFWLPKYLYDARGFDLKQAASVGWIPYAASGIGSLCGGYLSSRLLARNFSVVAACMKKKRTHAAL